MKKLSILLGCITLSAATFAQERQYEWFIIANTNLYLPGKGSEKGVYPILWYDKTTKPKLLIGGFGVGASVFRSLTGNLSLKGQANFSKNAYWEEAMELRGMQNEPLGHFQYGGSDFSLGVAGTLHYLLSEKMSVGTGAGARLFTMTLSRTPSFENFELVADEIAINRYTKSVLPFIPIEWTLKGEKLLFNIRYEYGLSNRYKRGLAAYKTDRFSVLNFEVGFRIGK